MPEIIKLLEPLAEGQTVTGDGDIIVLTPEHTHSDLIRYMIGDIGADDVEHLTALLCKEARNA